MLFNRSITQRCFGITRSLQINDYVIINRLLDYLITSKVFMAKHGLYTRRTKHQYTVTVSNVLD
jgi:hypothetical protein